MLQSARIALEREGFETRGEWMGGKHEASARSGTARAAPARRRLHLRHLDFETRAIVCQSASFELVAMAFWDLPVGHGHPARISAPGGERIPLTNLVWVCICARYRLAACLVVRLFLVLCAHVMQY